MARGCFLVLLALTVAGPAGAAPAKAPGPILLVRDQLTEVAPGIAALCTGIGADTQNDARANGFAMRIEFVGRTGQYLANARVKLATLAGKPLAHVQCPGAWLLFQMAPLKLHLTATLQGHTRRTTAFALEGGTRVILRFPEIAGNQ